MTTLTVLAPSSLAGEVIGTDPGERRLTQLYAHPAKPFVRVNMVSSLDGAAYGAAASSSNINNAADMRVFRVIRSVADVVLVGAGTARQEDYQNLHVSPALAATRAARGQGDLRLAVVTASGNLPPQLLALPGLIVITKDDRAVTDRLRPHVDADHLICAGTDRVDLAAAVATLAARGLARIVCEGGPTLLGWALHDGVVAEVCVTHSPLLVAGPAARIVASQQWLNPPLPARLGHLLGAGDTLLGRWLLTG